MARAAALALCLLALAAGVSAQCADAGKYIKMDLMGIKGGFPPPDNPIFKCLTSFKATIVDDSGCALQITPLQSGGSYIPGMWAGLPSRTYQQLQECPITSGFKHVLGSVDSAGIKLALEEAIGAFPYGWDIVNTVAYKPFDLDAPMFYAGGGVRITVVGLDPVFYSITELTLNSDPLNILLETDDAIPVPVTIVSPSLDATGNGGPNGQPPTLTPDWIANDPYNDVTTDPLNPAPIVNPGGAVLAPYYMPNDVIGSACPPHSYPIVMGKSPNEYAICALCPAGTNSTSGFGCTTCPAGYRSSQGDVCSRCPPGTYSQAGSSDCLPCPSGTYAPTPGTATCLECPEDTYAWIPGSPYCMRCINGVPEACDGPNGACASDPVLSATVKSSPGTMIILPDTLVPGDCPLATIDFSSTAGAYNNPPTLELRPEWEFRAAKKCSTWASGTAVDTGVAGTAGVMQLALKINGDCSIQISPITDETCANPTDPQNDPLDPSFTTADPTDPAYVPTYGEIEMRAYYAPGPVVLDGAGNLIPDTPDKFRIMSLFDTFMDGQTGPPISVVDPVPPNRTVANSLMLNFEMPNPVANPSEFLIDMYWFAATTNPKLAGPNAAGAATLLPDAVLPDPTTGLDATVTCKVTGKLVGGFLMGRNAEGVVAASEYICPAGTYFDANQWCPVCPVGHWCPGGTGTLVGTAPTGITNPAADKFKCKPNEFNPFLGLGGSGTALSDVCEVCAPPDPTQPYPLMYTSYEGAASCDVERVDLLCEDAVLYDVTKGWQYDIASQECILCPPGTARDMADPSVTECQLCPPGTYSEEGAPTCTPCPIGQYNPLDGLPDQTGITGQVCISCADGSVALAVVGGTPQDVSDPALVLQTEASFCDACPAGTYVDDPITGCTACPADTYRSGDATPENNVCLPIPAGYKLKPAVPGSVLPNSEIELCDKGTVSFYAVTPTSTPDAVRLPEGQPEQCISCADIDAALGLAAPALVWAHTFAPRKGMTQCIPCPGGTIPLTGQTTPSGANAVYGCGSCPNTLYRDAYTVSAECLQCPLGNEVGPSSKMDCTACRPGFFMDDVVQDTANLPAARAASTNQCAPCATNFYRPTFGATSCLPCPRGTGTANTGNVECTACPIGYYNNQAGTPCKPAPAGTYVNVTSSFVFTPCPAGSWNNEQANDNCNPCAPGKYSNTLGAKECKTCPAGTYSGGQATSCVDCKAGYAAPAGAGSCSPCKPGTYAPDAKSATCKLCPKGFQCPTNAMRLQGPCPRGTFSNKEGNRLCTPCPVNTYSLGGGTAAAPSAVMACIRCQAGTDTRGLTGQSRCQVKRPQVRRLSML